jgi:hypothetical protein
MFHLFFYIQYAHLCILLTECIFGFHVILRIYSDYFLKQQKPTDIYNGEVFFPLRYGLNS